MKYFAVIVVAFFGAFVAAEARGVELRAVEFNQDQPIMPQITDITIGKIINFGYRMHEFLNDRDASKSVYQAMDNAKENVKGLVECINGFILQKLQDNTNYFGKIITNLRNGQTIESLKDLKDLRRANFIQIFFEVQSMIADGFTQAKAAFKDAKEGVQTACFLDGPGKKIKDDIDAVSDQYGKWFRENENKLTD